MDIQLESSPFTIFSVSYILKINLKVSTIEWLNVHRVTINFKFLYIGNSLESYFFYCLTFVCQIKETRILVIQ